MTVGHGGAECKVHSQFRQVRTTCRFSNRSSSKTPTRTTVLHLLFDNTAERETKRTIRQTCVTKQKPINYSMVLVDIPRAHSDTVGCAVLAYLDQTGKRQVELGRRL